MPEGVGVGSADKLLDRCVLSMLVVSDARAKMRRGYKLLFTKAFGTTQSVLVHAGRYSVSEAMAGDK